MVATLGRSDLRVRINPIFWSTEQVLFIGIREQHCKCLLNVRPCSSVPLLPRSLSSQVRECAERSSEGQHVEWPSSEGLLPFSVYAALKRIVSPFSELYVTTPFLFLFFFLF